MSGAVALSLAASLDAGSVTGTHLLGRELALWRDADGAPHVWEDRCPHRGMRMSLGFVRGSAIACLYHGWRYGADGRCEHIPAHPDLAVPDTIRVPVFPVVEAAGIVWTAADGDLVLPDLPPGPVTAVRSVTVDRGEDDLWAAVAALPAPDGSPVGIEAAGDRVRLLTLGGDRLVAALQPVETDRSVLHLVLIGDDAAPERLERLAGWAVALRVSAEGAAGGEAR